MPESEIPGGKISRPPPRRPTGLPPQAGGSDDAPKSSARPLDTGGTLAKPPPVPLEDYRARLTRPAYAYLRPFADPLLTQLESETLAPEERQRLTGRLSAMFAVSHAPDGFGLADVKRASNAYHAELGKRAIAELERMATSSDLAPGARWDAMSEIARRLEHDLGEVLEDDVALTIDLGTRAKAEESGNVDVKLRIAPNFLELLIMLALLTSDQRLLPQVGPRAQGRTALDRRGHGRGGADANTVVATANNAFAAAATAALGANVQVANVQGGRRLTAADGTAFTVRVMACPLGNQVVRPVLNHSKSDVIQLSDDATDSDVARGLAQALGELAAHHRALAQNTMPPANDELRRGDRVPGDVRWSAHDQGAIAQLALVLPQMTMAQVIDAPQRRVRMDIMGLIDDLGLRGDGAAALARRNAVLTRLADLGVAQQPQHWLRIMSADDGGNATALRRALFESRVEEAQTDRIDKREDRRSEPLHRPALQGAQRTPQEAALLATGARLRRAAKSAQMVTKYRGLERDAQPDLHRVRDPQLGGGAALANIRPGQLLIDGRGRWQQDGSHAVAQTAAQLRWVRDAGIGDPFEFVANPNDRVPLDAVSYWLDTLAMQADVIDGAGALEVDHQSRLVLRVTPADNSGPITLEVGGQPVVASGFPRENTPLGRINITQVVPAVILAIGASAAAGAQAFKAKLETLDIRDDAAVADVMNNVPQTATDPITQAGDPGAAALAQLRQAAGASRAWVDERARNPRRVLTGDEANSLATLDPTAAQHWVITGMGGTGISAAEIILDRNPQARVTMVGGNPTPGLADNDQFQRIWRTFGPAGQRRFEALAFQDVGGVQTNNAGQTYTAGAGVHGQNRLDAVPQDLQQMPVAANSTWLVAADLLLVPAIQRILGVAGTKVTIYGQALPDNLHADQTFGQLINTHGPAGGFRLQVASGNYAAVANQVQGGQGGFRINPVEGEGYIAALGRGNGLSPVLNQLIREAKARGPNNARGELLWDPDQQYLGYRVIIVAPNGGEKRIDVTGAASRFLPPELFDQQARDLVTEAGRRDAPAESGNFDGGFAASAMQAARYGRNRRNEVETTQVTNLRMSGRQGQLVLDPNHRDQWAELTRTFLAGELHLDRERIRVVALGGGGTGDPLFAVSVGEVSLGVFKVFRDQNQAQTELDQLAFLAQLNLQHSRAVTGRQGIQPVQVGQDQGRRGILMSTAPGQSVDGMVSHLPAIDAPNRAIAVEQIVASSRLVARALAEIHRLTNTNNQMLDQNAKTGQGSDAAYILTKITAQNPRALAVRTAFDADEVVITQRLQLRIQQLGAANVPATAYHGDANAGNFMMDGQQVTVIDVGNVGWSHQGNTGTKSGANDIAKYLGSLETLHPVEANRLQPNELQQISGAFMVAYFAEFNQGGRNTTEQDLTAAIAIYKVEQLIAAFHGNSIDAPALRARVKGVLGL